MRLGIDLDGVVADFSTGWMGFYNDQYGTSFVPEMVTGWDAIPELTHFADMDEFWEWSKDLDGASLFRNLETYPGVVDKMWELTREGFELVIITTKPFFAIHDTFAWLSDNRIPTREVHIIENKWNVDVEVYLEGIRKLSGPVARLAKRATLIGERERFLERLDEVEELYLGELMELSDAHEGVSAFLERREPVWSHA